MNIYKIKNRQVLIKKLYDIESVVLLGKGPTLEKYKSSENYDFIIGINDSVNLHECNMLLGNDYDTFERISKKSYKKLEYIAMPITPHVDFKPGNKSYLDVIDLANKNGFTGDFIPYNLITSAININYITLPTAITSTNNAAEFIKQIMINVKNVALFGVGVNSGYHKEVFDAELNQYNDLHLSNIKSHIETALEGKTVIFN